MPILTSERGARTFINIVGTAACVPLCKGWTKQLVGVGILREGLVAVHKMVPGAHAGVHRHAHDYVIAQSRADVRSLWKAAASQPPSLLLASHTSEPQEWSTTSLMAVIRT
jgi:hypothetical protein